MIAMETDDNHRLRNEMMLFLNSVIWKHQQNIERHASFGGKTTDNNALQLHR